MRFVGMVRDWSCAVGTAMKGEVDMVGDSEMTGIEEGSHEKQVFAVYCAGDRSLRIYNRVEVPQEGEEFEGRTADAVYADVLDQGVYSRIRRDRDIVDVEFVDEGVGDRLLAMEMESQKKAGSEKWLPSSIWVRILAGVLGGVLLGLLTGTVLQCLR